MSLSHTHLVFPIATITIPWCHAHACVGVGKIARDLLDHLSSRPRVRGSWDAWTRLCWEYEVTPTRAWELGHLRAANHIHLRHAHACVGVGPTVNVEHLFELSRPRVRGSWRPVLLLEIAVLVTPTRAWELGWVVSFSVGGNRVLSKHPTGFMPAILAEQRSDQCCSPTHISYFRLLPPLYAGVEPTHVWELGNARKSRATSRRRAHACVGVGRARLRSGIQRASCPRMCGSWA